MIMLANQSLGKRISLFANQFAGRVASRVARCADIGSAEGFA